jgi:hypothetical protein
MSKGRNTTVVGVRLPDDVVDRLKALASERQVSLSDLLKPVIGSFAVNGHLYGVTYTVDYPMGNIGTGLTESTTVADTNNAEPEVP